MKARITTIALSLGRRLFEVGDVVERGVDLPTDIFDVRLNAGTLELVGDQPSAGILEAIASWRGLFEGARAATALLAETALAGSLADKRAFIDALAEMGRAGAPASAAVAAIMAEVETADAAELQTLSPSGLSSLGEDEAGGAPPAASEAGGGHAVSPPAESSAVIAPAPAGEDGTSSRDHVEGDAAPSADVAPAAASEVSSGVEQSAARVAHNHEVAGSSPAPAPTDAPQPEAGTDGDAAGASAPAAEPKPPSATSPPVQKPARKGGPKAAK